MVLNQSSDSIDLERVRIATADVLGVWEPRVYAASSNTPCGFHLQWCESDGLRRSLISLSHKLPGVSMSAPPLGTVTSRTCYEDGVGCTAPHCSLSYTGMLCLPVTKLFTSESTSGYTVVSMSLLGYKQDDDPLGLHSVLPASPMCAAPGACDYCECGPGQLSSDGCLTGQLGQQPHPSGGSGSGAGFSASAIANLSAAVGASIEFASFDSMRSSVYERMNLWKRDATISLVLLGLPAWCSLLWLLLSLARLLRRRLVAPVEALLVALLNQIEMTELRQRWRARGADPRGVDAVRWAARGVVAFALPVLPWLPAVLALSAAWPLAHVDIRAPTSNTALRESAMRTLRTRLRWAILLAGIVFPLWLTGFASDSILWLRVLQPWADARPGGFEWWPLLLWPFVLGQSRWSFTYDIFSPLRANELGRLAAAPIRLSVFWAVCFALLANALLVLDCTIGNVVVVEARSSRQAAVAANSRASAHAASRGDRRGGSSSSWQCAAARVGCGGLLVILSTVLPACMGIAATASSSPAVLDHYAASIYAIVTPITCLLLFGATLASVLAAVLTRSVSPNARLHLPYDERGCGGAVDEEEGGTSLLTKRVSEVNTSDMPEQSYNKFIAHSELILGQPSEVANDGSQTLPTL